MDSCADTLSWWSGIAPLAKLAVTDVGTGLNHILSGLDNLDLYTGFYPWPYIR